MDRPAGGKSRLGEITPPGPLQIAFPLPIIWLLATPLRTTPPVKVDLSVMPHCFHAEFETRDMQNTLSRVEMPNQPCYQDKLAFGLREGSEVRNLSLFH